MSNIQNLKAQIIDTERLLEMVKDHPTMPIPLRERLEMLKEELASISQKPYVPKIQLLFSGNAVIGSVGIKSSFVSKLVQPFHEMIKTNVAMIKYGTISQRGKIKKNQGTELYLTALPKGSFGIELSQLHPDEIFDYAHVGQAMNDVIHLLEESTTSDESFDKLIESTPKRNLINLKNFLKVIVEEQSILKIESSHLSLVLPKDKVIEAWERVSFSVGEEYELIKHGTFRGLLLDSGKFEIVDIDGVKISGFISENLDEDTLIRYDKEYLNTECEIHLKVLTTKYKTGNEKIEYELLEIR